MQTASTNICERLCNKSIREISLLLNIPRSTVSGIITKWKQQGTTATQPRSGRPHKRTEWSQHMLKCTVRRSLQLSAESIAKDLQIHAAFRLAQLQCIESLMKWVSMAEQLHPSLTSASAMQSIECNGVKHATIGL
ncbi:unnamed protein product [Staurois parvus]|uniref:Insertion element IS150 protein InsJ-like helix-turn-helix domain-containing protein n=1 Tax=Staurois parvus TaxID=386267 RepID=A0ABN9CPR0_9NEOB|nr:unnamed protein product [Staurois parvus]